MPKKTGKDKEFSKLAPIEAKGAAFKNAKQLFGHVTLVQSYAVLSGDTGYCLVRLRDQPNKTVAVFTDEPHAPLN